jgi:phage shock protein A
VSILDRLRRLIASNINALIDSLSDPGSAIDELIGNMEAAAREAREHVKDALTEDKRAARHVQALGQSIAEWHARAERAVKAGDDALAQEALERKQSLDAERAETEAARARGREELDELERGLRDLDAKLAAVKSRRETLKAVMRARAGGGGAAERYDRIVQDVDVKEAENALDAELGDRETSAATADVRARIDRLANEREAEARLAALKDKMKK